MKMEKTVPALLSFLDAGNGTPGEKTMALIMALGDLLVQNSATSDKLTQALEFTQVNLERWIEGRRSDKFPPSSPLFIKELIQ